MIRRLLLAGILTTAPAWAQDAEGEPPVLPQPSGEQDPAPQGESDSESGDEEGSEAPEDPLSPYRTRFDVLTDRTIGTASRPVLFNWRRTHAQVAATGSFLVELNNFNTGRAGGLVRLPTQGTLVELGVSYAWVGDTPSSELLALTPYRQPGRPSRMEVDAGVSIPLAEGIVTTAPRWFPAAQLVFSAYAGVRYSLYRRSWTGLRPGQVARAILAPGLNDQEIDNLDVSRLDAMEVDPGRYGIMAGIGNDIYFKQGLFVAPRMLFHVPLLAPASESRLYFQIDVSLAIGVAL